MSDLYDSLEDEADDESYHSLDKLKTIFANPGEGLVDYGSISDGHEPFFLEGKAKTEGHHSELQPVQSFTVTNLGSKNCDQIQSSLPKVDNEIKKCGSNNLIIDNEDLVKKGLQLNKDGSFTKSPRLETEQLPFVNPEYKNLQFQKMKTEVRMKGRCSKKNRKNMFTFKKNSKDEISMIEIINSREAKGSSEEILTSRGSLLSFKEASLKSGENFDNENLTDSMKEMIIQKQTESLTVRANKSLEQFKKPKRGISFSGDRKYSKMYSKKSDLKERLPHVSGDKQNTCQPNFDERKSQSNTWKKKLPQVPDSTPKTLNPVVKKKNELFLNISQPRLSYFERRQRENGFNPLYLRQGVKRAPSDTNRSNFGDSVVDGLSEESSRVASSRGLSVDEDEEMFYRKLIEKDKSKQWEESRTSRSEIHNEKEKCVHANSSNSFKNQKEMKGNDKCYGRQTLKKSTSIDMPKTTVNFLMNSNKKCSHYCSVNASPSLSKTELALKAKAYGYMANARNIFKMKTLSEGKFVQSESEATGRRILKKVTNNKMSARRNESSEEINQRFWVTSNRLLRTSKSLCQDERYESVADKELVLPPVCCSETMALENKSEVLKQMRCCLNDATNQSTCNADLNYGYCNMKALREKYAESLPPFKCAR